MRQLGSAGIFTVDVYFTLFLQAKKTVIGASETILTLKQFAVVNTECKTLSGIYIDIHICSLRMNFNKNKRNMIFLTGKKLNL